MWVFVLQDNTIENQYVIFHFDKRGSFVIYVRVCVLYLRLFFDKCGHSVFDKCGRFVRFHPLPDLQADCNAGMFQPGIFPFSRYELLRLFSPLLYNTRSRCNTVLHQRISSDFSEG